jgi:hypothetical protein
MGVTWTYWLSFTEPRFDCAKKSTLFWRYAYEAPDVIASRSRVPKITACDGTNQVYCVAYSHLMRTAQLAAGLRTHSRVSLDELHGPPAAINWM